MVWQLRHPRGVVCFQRRILHHMVYAQRDRRSHRTRVMQSTVDRRSSDTVHVYLVCCALRRRISVCIVNTIPFHRCHSSDACLRFSIT
jgi:hypothetical protein